MRSPRMLFTASCLGLAFGLSLGACLTVNEQEDFELEARDLVCEYNRTCAQNMGEGDLFTDPFYPYPADDTCEEAFEDARRVCVGCRYNPSAAHKCLNRMEEALMTCDTSEISFEPCRKVYKECEDGSDEVECDIDDPACSVGGEPRPLHAGLALGLLVIGAWRRRTRV